MKFRTLALCGLLLLGLVACGGSGSGTASPASTAAASTLASSSAAPSTAATASGGSTTTAITERDFKFDTPDVTIAGATSFAVTNAGPTIHNLTIRDASGKMLAATKDLKSGSSETLAVSLPAGKYTMFCSLAGHESLGLKGTLTVTP